MGVQGGSRQNSKKIGIEKIYLQVFLEKTYVTKQYISKKINLYHILRFKKFLFGCVVH